MRKPPSAVVLALALMSGCGGDGGGKGGGGAGKGPTVTVAAERPIAFTAEEYAFKPSRVVVRSDGAAGETLVRFTLRNDGALAHDLRVQRGGEDLGGTPIFVRGRTEAAQASLEPGRYELICTVGDHADLGMKGTLVVSGR